MRFIMTGKSFTFMYAYIWHRQGHVCVRESACNVYSILYCMRAIRTRKVRGLVGLRMFYENDLWRDGIQNGCQISLPSGLWVILVFGPCQKFAFEVQIEYAITTALRIYWNYHFWKFQPAQTLISFDSASGAALLNVLLLTNTSNSNSYNVSLASNSRTIV